MNGNKIIFSFFEVWGYYSNNIVLSMVLFLAFPIYVLIIDAKNIFKNKELFFSSIMILVGIAEFCLLS